MKIVIATDKFKGSLSSFQVCHAIARGLQQASAQFQITQLPLSDGGDGMADVVAHYTKARKVFVTVSDPLFRPVQVHYFISENNQTAFIEMAQASGLMLLHPSEYNPLETTSLGTGQLVKDAIRRGVTKIILGIGGSATNDCGIGIAAALGYRFFDRQQHELKPVGKSLGLVHTIDATNVQAGKKVTIDVACDVSNPLAGEQGATKIYGPQKGATPEMIHMLEKGMLHFAAQVKEQFQVDLTTIAGGGAAGGAGAGCALFLKAQLTGGVALLLQYSEAERYIKEADLVLTGEGKLDAQTLQGKVVHGVMTLCAKYGKPVVALCGTLDVDLKRLQDAGLTAAFSIITQPMTLAEAVAQSENLLANAAFNLGNFFKTSYPSVNKLL